MTGSNPAVRGWSLTSTCVHVAGANLALSYDEQQWRLGGGQGS